MTRSQVFGADRGGTRARLPRMMLAAVTAGLLLPASGEAAVTIGSDLGRAPTTAPVCSPAGCTLALAGLPVGFRAPGGLTSPVNGTINVWRVRSGGGSPSAALRVVRPFAGGLFRGAGTSNPPGIGGAGINTFSAALPIAIGDQIGVDSSVGNVLRPHPSSLTALFDPPLANGGPGRSPNVFNARELALNATIEPTSAVSVRKAKRRKKGKLRVVVNLPNPGTLIAGDKRDAKTGATTAAKKKKKKLLKRKRIEVGGPGKRGFTLKPTKFARKLLKARFLRTGNKKAKIKVRVRLAFIPAFGTTRGIATKKTKLRR